MVGNESSARSPLQMGDNYKRWMRERCRVGTENERKALIKAGHLKELAADAELRQQITECIDELQGLIAQNESEFRRLRAISRELDNGIPHCPGVEPTHRISDLAKQVAKKYNLTISDLRSERRHKYVSIARHELCYLAYQKTLLSFPQIGRFLGGRDHTTIMHGVKRHAERNNLPVPLAKFNGGRRVP